MMKYISRISETLKGRHFCRIALISLFITPIFKIKSASSWSTVTSAITKKQNLMFLKQTFQKFAKISYLKAPSLTSLLTVLLFVVSNNILKRRK